MNRPEATLVVAQRGCPELTIDCVRSLRASDPARWRIVVVDDGSESRDRLRVGRALRGVEHRAQAPQGVSAAWNLGARHASSRYLVFVNNDVVSREPWVERLLQPLECGEAVVSGPSLRQERLLPVRTLQRLITSSFVAGWCFALSSELFFELGGFDESLRLYYSDTDLQLRALAHTRRCVCGLTAVPELGLRHWGHRSTSRLSDRRRLLVADWRRFVQKWASYKGVNWCASCRCATRGGLEGPRPVPGR